MIAEIYILKRMPRRIKVFDYSVEPSMKLKPGDLVEVSLRKQRVLGIVKQLKDKPFRGIRLVPVTQIIEKKFIREEQLSFFESLAFDLAQSVSSVLYTSLPIPPKRVSKEKNKPLKKPVLSVPKSEYNSIVRTVNQLSNRRTSFVFLSDLKRMAAVLLGFLRENANEKTLVVAPTILDAKRLHKHLPAKTHLLTSEHSNNDRYLIWKKFASESTGCLIGTKQSLLLADEKITNIFLIRSGNPSHKQHDRNPRYDVRLIAWDLQKQYHTNLFFLDVLPRVDDLAMFPQTNIPGYSPSVKPGIIDLNKERPTSEYFVLSSSALLQIKETLSQDQKVICVFNRKANDEFGIESLTNTLSKEFSNHNVKSFYKEKKNSDDSDILVTTNYYLENIFDPFSNSRYGLIAHLNPDAGLFAQSFRALESTLLNVEQWRAVANAYKSNFLLQTQDSELFEKFFENPLTILKDELQTRSLYGQPPTRQWFRISFQDSESRKEEIAIKEIERTIRQTVNNAKIIGPKKTKRGMMFECGILLDDSEKLLSLLATLKDQYIIDTHAFSS